MIHISDLVQFCKTTRRKKKKNFVHSIKMKLSIAKIAKIRGIKGCKSTSKDELLSSLTSSKPAKKGKKPKTNFSKARIEEIRKEFNEFKNKRD